MIQNLSIDLETRSSVDIVKSSVYRYAESDDFDILLFGISVNHGPIRVYDLAQGDTVPADILKALTDDTVEKGPITAVSSGSACPFGSAGSIRNSSLPTVMACTLILPHGSVPWYWAYTTACPSDWKRSALFSVLKSRN